jgi:hypothetical protein
MFQYPSIYEITEDTSENEFDRILDNWLRRSMEPETERNEIVAFLEAVKFTRKTNLLEIFVETMIENSPGESIYIDYNEKESQKDVLPYLANLLTNSLNEGILDIIVQVFDPEYYGIVEGLMSVNNPDYLNTGIRNLRYIFKDVRSELDKNSVETLYDKAKESGIPLLEIYLSEELEELNKSYAEIPEWIITNDVLYTHRELVESLKLPEINKWVSISPEEDAQYMCTLAEEDKDLEQLYVDLLEKFNELPKSEREELITKINTNNTLMLLALDEEMFRVLGGCLPMGEAYELKVKSKDPCLMYGGCRANTCYENHNVNFETEEPLIHNPVGRGLLGELEWFTGRCDNQACLLYIRRKHYAVRMPMESGGWMGCFCSFGCIIACLPEDNETRLRLTEGFEKIYKGVGIYERL